MKLGWDPNNSLTGNEFLDFLSWCEAGGIDIEEKEDQQEETEEENKPKIKKMKGRDIYEKTNRNRFGYNK